MCLRVVRCSIFDIDHEGHVSDQPALAPSLVLALTVGRFSHMSVLVKDLVGNEYKLELTGLQTVLDLKKLLEQTVRRGWSLSRSSWQPWVSRMVMSWSCRCFHGRKRKDFDRLGCAGSFAGPTASAGLTRAGGMGQRLFVDSERPLWPKHGTKRELWRD
eukprot:s2985_g12.t2